METQNPEVIRRIKRKRNASMMYNEVSISRMKPVHHFGETLSKKVTQRMILMANRSNFLNDFVLADEPNWEYSTSIENGVFQNTNTFEFHTKTGLQASIVKNLLGGFVAIFHVTCYLFQWEFFKKTMKRGASYIHFTKYWCLCDASLRVGTTPYTCTVHRHMIMMIPKKHMVDFHALMVEFKKTTISEIISTKLICMQITDTIDLAETLNHLFTPLQNCIHLRKRKMGRINTSLFLTNVKETMYLNQLRLCSKHPNQFQNSDIFYTNSPIMPNVVKFLLFFDARSLALYAKPFINSVQSADLPRSFCTIEDKWYTKFLDLIRGDDEFTAAQDMLLPVPETYQICGLIPIGINPIESSESIIPPSNKYLFCGSVIVFFEDTRICSPPFFSVAPINLEMYKENMTFYNIMKFVIIEMGAMSAEALGKMLRLARNPQLLHKIRQIDGTV